MEELYLCICKYVCTHQFKTSKRFCFALFSLLLLCNKSRAMSIRFLISSIKKKQQQFLQKCINETDGFYFSVRH